MVKTTIYIEPDTALAFRQMAESQGRSQAELIRDALEAYAKKAKRPLPAGLGKYDSGETDVSERVEDILREASKLRIPGQGEQDSGVNAKSVPG